MRFTTLILTSLATVALASPLADTNNNGNADALEERAPINVLCSCAATSSCGCNSVIAGSWCVCNGDAKGSWNAAPCQGSTSCGCSGLGKWGVCEIV
ncbi:hypothetical protein COL5a_001639 [Colletotrichum fioriniae]|uniref:uncharacterized protein n=1 Tax=Colletotrichum fioriniae TaxID=710243 RepID=UPI002301B9CC|nr:uncharacterized protein COL516b_002712 [Colletotrichum fioriniae]KAJ0309467.1 hypothetical protein COL516b_002712 [Colletotrichum fioriniae]KAJ0332911.1 hypothetical protein COL5a_001639 [Colletotrichum fioriniae]KAJ3946734.1 hypothetical protein N0V96_003108 [Colletotrichum fioriniae]